MFKHKKLFTILLSLCMIMMMGITALTAEIAEGETDTYHNEENGNSISKAKASPSINTGLIDEVFITEEEQLEELESSDLTDEQKAIIIKKLTSAETSLQETTRATTWTFLAGRFYIYKQETTYYCVPASVKAAMQYLTGSSDSQSTIADALGTTSSGTPLSDGKTYLNRNQFINTYASKSASTSLTTIKSNLHEGITVWDAPPLIAVALSVSNGWAYDTTGHVMLISGARSDQEYFRIADPYIQWADPYASMFYDKSANVIYKAISDRGTGYIY